MAHVHVIQRNAYLAGAVKLDHVNGREGRVARAVLTAISNVRRGNGDSRDEESIAIQWTLWGKQAENAAAYLGKGSHVNIVGRVRNNNFEKDGQLVYGLTFTAEEVDYLESRADAEARRGVTPLGRGASATAPAPASVGAVSAGAAATSALSAIAAAHRKATARA